MVKEFSKCCSTGKCDQTKLVGTKSLGMNLKSGKQTLSRMMEKTSARHQISGHNGDSHDDHNHDPKPRCRSRKCKKNKKTDRMMEESLRHHMPGHNGDDHGDHDHDHTPPQSSSS